MTATDCAAPMTKLDAAKASGIFESLLDPIFLQTCFRRAARGKRGRISIAKYSAELEANIYQTIEILKSGHYNFGPYRSFYVNEPKKRLIESACFPDRIVHQALFARLEPLFDTGFYDHSYACRTGRGSHLAMLTLQKWLRNQDLKFYLKCDVRKYFQSIDREILLKLLAKKLGDNPMLINLLEKLIRNSPGSSGIPIGNLTSQLFANIYLNELDLFVKRQLSVKRYIRYMDDFILLAKSKDEAVTLRRQIESFLDRKLKLELSPQKVRIAPVTEGIPFVGYNIYPNKIKLRGSTLRRSRNKVFKRFQTKDFQSLTARDPFHVARVRNCAFQGSWHSFIGLVSYCTNGTALAMNTKAQILERWKEKCALTI